MRIFCFLCEALYCAVEAKTTITKDEIAKAYKSAAKVRKLQPFKQPLIAARKDGARTEDDRDRCLYIVIAFTSNLANGGSWTKKGI